MEEEAARPAVKFPRCHPANRKFSSRLAGRRDAAAEAGRIRLSKCYTRALRSIGLYPLPVTSAHDALGLDGIGKNVSSIFEEVFESEEQEEVLEADVIAWRSFVHKRFERALKATPLSGTRAVAAASFRKRKRCESISQSQEPLAVRPGALVPNKSNYTLRSPERVSPEGVAIVPVPPPTQCSTAQPRPCRLSLAARCRRSIAQKNPPASGSSAWLVLVALGLYAGDASGRALTQREIERCVSSLRPQLARCDQLRWSAAARLQNRGFVESLDDGRWRLTDLGRPIAEKAVRKLEVPLTALSPLRVGKSQACAISPPKLVLEQALVPFESDRGAAVDLSDDAPLSSLVAHNPAATALSSSHHGDWPPCSPPRTQSFGKFAYEAASPGAAAMGLGGNYSSRSPGEKLASSSCCQQQQQQQQQQQEQLLLTSPPSARVSKRRLKAVISAPALPTSQPSRVLTPHKSAPEYSSSQRKGPTREARLVLLLDHREVGAGREHKTRGALLADLGKRLGDLAVEGRSLPLGDVLWIWREPARHDALAEKHGNEFIAGWVVERKTLGDLSSSVVDGRYDEQKARLLDAPGLDGVIYLVEGNAPLFGVPSDKSIEANGQSPSRPQKPAASQGFGQRLLQRSSLPASTLSTVAVHTQLISGFHVTHTTSTAHSVTSLVALHQALLRRGPPLALGDLEDLPVTYRDFAEKTRKSCHSRAFEAFGRMLRVIPHCGPEATEALVDEFPSIHALATALRDSSDTELLLRLKARRGGRAPVSATALAACRALFVA